METESWLGPLRERDLIPDDTLAAFVVGSAARGWHNNRSDFDIYVVTSSDRTSESSRSISMPLNPPHIRSEMFYEDARRWEVTYWLDAQIEQMLAKVSWQHYDSDVMAGGVLTPREEVSLARVRDCLPLLGLDWLATRRQQFDDSAFRSFVVARSLEAADGAAEDALGQMESDSMASATISARRAFEHTIDALLESHGEYGSHMPKWRPHKYRIAQPAVLAYEDYWAFETMRDYDPADPARWITAVLTLCQDISMSVETR